MAHCEFFDLARIVGQHARFSQGTDPGFEILDLRLPPALRRHLYHTFRATEITEYLRNGGKLEVAHPDGQTTRVLVATGLYDGRNDHASADEMEGY